MSLIRRRSVVAASLSLGTVSALALVAAVLGACSSSDNGAADAATPSADASDSSTSNIEDAAVTLLPFQPSNVDLSGIDTSKIGDQDITGDCELSSNDGTFGDCFTDGKIGTGQVLQSDGTKVTVIIVKSLRIEAAAHVTVTGGLPLVLVTKGDMTILGSLDAHGEGDTGTAGGFTQTSSNTKGSGPGGGPAATGVGESTPGLGGGGGSFCGLGGIGGTEQNATGTQTATPAYGSADLRPLMAGSSGGNGAAGGAGAGGGAVQLVAGGIFTMNGGATINVGGGGGNFGGVTGQNAAGGGSGGAVLIEAATATIAGIIAANGGGGGAGGSASASGSDGDTTNTVTPGGTGGSPGGGGGAGDTANGTVGLDTAGSSAGGGGGGVGRIRINTTSGTALLTNATISPSLTPATGSVCSSLGTVRAPGSGV